MSGVRSGQEFSRTWSCLLLCGSCPLSTSPLLDYESRRKWKLQLTYSDTRTGVKIIFEMALHIEMFMVQGKIIIYCHALTTPTVIVGPSHLCEWSGGALAGALAGGCRRQVPGGGAWQGSVTRAVRLLSLRLTAAAATTEPATSRVTLASARARASASAGAGCVDI